MNSEPIDPPALALQTVYFREDDREGADELGKELYNRLTRPLGDPLAHGAGIPVWVGVPADKVDTKVALATVVIPVLGKTSAMIKRDWVIRKLKEWHAELKRDGLLLPVLTSRNWRNFEAKFPVKPLLSMLFPMGDPTLQTLDEIILAISRLWGKAGKVVPFISHAKADLSTSDEAAKKIFGHIVTNTTGHAFFDANSLHAGKPLEEQIITHAGEGMLIAVHGDEYGSRIWCQKELLTAKLKGLPTLTVEVLHRGERRSYPYDGNGPTILWNGDPAVIVSQAMVEWLCAEFFRRDAARIKEAASLPNDLEVVARPPELLDLTQGPLRFDGAKLVLHPDPELSVVERELLRIARPRLRLVTPTTAFRPGLSRNNGKPDVTCPLDGMQVAMSLSDLPTKNVPPGIMNEHAKDATVHVVRTLVSSGASIAYGGDFRRSGYTILLAQLLQGYNQTALDASKCLVSYMAGAIEPSDAPDGIAVTAVIPSEEPWRNDKILPTFGAGGPAAPFYFSDMRRFMESQVQARVILGGAAEPRLEKDGEGYSGRYPGVVEEAWRALQKAVHLQKSSTPADKKRHPLYVVGGFGGAAALVADLLEHNSIPELLTDGVWLSQPHFAETARTLDSAANKKWRQKLGLPLTMQELAESILTLAKDLLPRDESWKEWNGLSKRENLQLFRTRDAMTVAALVSKGLLNVARQQVASKLQIELVLDSLTGARNLDVVAIATLEDVPLGGAGAALDQVTGGLATMARSRGSVLISLEHAHIDADWLLMVSLGMLGEAEFMEERIRKAAGIVADEIRTRGLQRVGTVLFGGNILPDVSTTATAMVDGLMRLAGNAVLVLHEVDEARFRRLEKVLLEDNRVSLTTFRPQVKIAAPPMVPLPIVLNVTLENGKLRSNALLPRGGATTPTYRVRLKESELEELSKGEGDNSRCTPSMETLEKRGKRLGELLFGPHAETILSECISAPIWTNHDTEASRLPFEMLLASDAYPAQGAGLTRRLGVLGLGPESLFRRAPKKGPLEVLLVINPTNDLSGADEEALSVEAILQTQSSAVRITTLKHKQANADNFKEALAGADVLHYCGHGFYRGPKPGESGIFLAGYTRFTAVDMSELHSLPRMAFMNACEIARVRGEKSTGATSFAELFIRSGIDAYLGTFWEVGDAAAARFAGQVYENLAKGETLEKSVLLARQILKEAKEKDWANYMLFGGADFRLIASEQT